MPAFALKIFTRNNASEDGANRLIRHPVELLSHSTLILYIIHSGLSIPFLKFFQLFFRSFFQACCAFVFLVPGRVLPIGERGQCIAERPPGAGKVICTSGETWHSLSSGCFSFVFCRLPPRRRKVQAADSKTERYVLFPCRLFRLREALPCTGQET